MESVANQYIVTLDGDAIGGRDIKTTFSSVAARPIADALRDNDFPIAFGEYLGADHVFTIRVSNDVEQGKLERALSHIPSFVSVEPDLVGYTASIVADDDDDQDYLGISSVNPTGTAAWNTTQGSSSTVVAVLDSGIKYDHPDLAANIWTGPSGEHGNDFVNPGTTPIDQNGHGTNVAGVLGAVGNTFGVTGILRKGKMISVRVTDPYLTYVSNPNLLDPAPAPQGVRRDTYMSNVVAGINYVCDLNESGVNVRVINASLTLNANYTGLTSASISALVNAVTRAKNDAIVFVAAAGNAADTLESYPSLPAILSDP